MEVEQNTLYSQKQASVTYDPRATLNLDPLISSFFVAFSK